VPPANGDEKEFAGFKCGRHNFHAYAASVDR
jgi:hypothetical protein